jgi:hypothetical protein
VIARDWFRYAEHDPVLKHNFNSISKDFLIYNRAWTGTREYRLKLLELLVDYNLVNACNVKFSPVDTNTNYVDHVFKNSQLAISRYDLDSFYPINTAESTASAAYHSQDYIYSGIEVVLETLFDDHRLHLTEKSLRPIACGQSFILCATHGSLKYLHSYGFKTFGDIIDESYDNIEDPYQRMLAIIHTMKSIASWTATQRESNMKKIQEITEYNQKYFFSNEFFNLVVNELKNNLTHAFVELETTNTSKNFIDLRKQLSQNLENRAILAKKGNKDKHQVLRLARKYYNRYLKTLNK